MLSFCRIHWYFTLILILYSVLARSCLVIPNSMNAQGNITGASPLGIIAIAKHINPIALLVLFRGAYVCSVILFLVCYSIIVIYSNSKSNI